MLQFPSLRCEYKSNNDNDKNQDNGNGKDSDEYITLIISLNIMTFYRCNGTSNGRNECDE